MKTPGAPGLLRSVAGLFDRAFSRLTRYRPGRAPATKYDKPFLKLIRRLLASRTDPGLVHVCPVCRGRLEVTFAHYMRGDKTMVGTTVDCRQCDTWAHLDSSPAPAWVPVPTEEDERRGRRLMREWLQRDPPPDKT